LADENFMPILLDDLDLDIDLALFHFHFHFHVHLLFFFHRPVKDELLGPVCYYVVVLFHLIFFIFD